MLSNKPVAVFLEQDWRGRVEQLEEIFSVLLKERELYLHVKETVPERARVQGSRFILFRPYCVEELEVPYWIQGSTYECVQIPLFGRKKDSGLKRLLLEALGGTPIGLSP